MPPCGGGGGVGVGAATGVGAGGGGGGVRSTVRPVEPRLRRSVSACALYANVHDANTAMAMSIPANDVVVFVILVSFMSAISGSG